ncbi:MAG TPA: outer membrane protein assembly factor BamD [Ignavibacteriaceae bacterium]|nr:outer membrane protein assembly factor BamD [Ignavibacteriaceae bacterium]
MKNIIIFLFSVFFLAGCAASIDTANLSPEDRLAYAMKLYQDEDYEEAVKEFEAIVLQFPGNAVVDDAQYYLGMTRFQRKEYILSAYEFSKLINNMAGSDLLSQAQYQLAECYYELSPDYSLDQKYTRKAISEFQSFVDFFPTDARVKEAESKIKELNNKLAYKEYSNAYIYERMEYYNAALSYYNNVIDTYYDSQYAPMAMYNRINIFINRDRDKEALAEINKFIERFPNDKNYSKVVELKNSLEKQLSINK